MSIDVEQLREAMSGGREHMASLLGEHPNPIVRLLAEQWSQRPAQTAPPQTEQPLVIDQTEQMLRRRITRLQAELTMRDDFLSALASALGACEVCWGEDTLCHDCRGRGRPAWKLPDQEQFARFIAPAARRMTSSQRAQRKGSSATIQRNPPPTQPSIGDPS